MQAEPRNIIHSMLGRENLRDASKEEIRRLAEEHPYSPVIQYLLTRRLQISSDPGYGDSVARTAIYFHNPHWLSQLLRRQTAEERTAELEESLGLAPAVAAPLEVQEAPIEEDAIEPPSPAAPEGIPEEVYKGDEIEVTPFTTEVEPPVFAAADAVTAQAETETEQQTAIIEETAVETETETEGAGYLESVHEEEAPSPAPTEGTVEAEEAGYPLPVQEEESASSAPTEGTVETEANGAEGWTGPEEADNDDDASIATEEGRPPSDLEPSKEGSDAAPVDGHVPDAPPVEIQKPQPSEGEEEAADVAPAMAEALGETEEVVPIQPLHTLDYFASMGVSLEQEVRKPAEAKVLSFPEWLRSMKPIHPTKADTAAAPALAEQRVREEAEESNEEEEILTEAMAEVFAKQGLRLKAIDIYRKLSLLHPDKSSIFAARIDQLKGITP